MCVLQTSNLLPVRRLGEVLFLPSRCLRVPGTAPPCQEAERFQQEGSMGTADPAAAADVCWCRAPMEAALASYRGLPCIVFSVGVDQRFAW